MIDKHGTTPRPRPATPKTVFWSDEDGADVAVAPDLPGCSSLGDIGPAAIAELDDAIGAWLEAAAKSTRASSS
jgi:predicted RNase H-like HicB family nuclease